MIQPKICSPCIEGNHESCEKKKKFSYMRGTTCECTNCWGFGK